MCTTFRAFDWDFQSLWTWNFRNLNDMPLKHINPIAPCGPAYKKGPSAKKWCTSKICLSRVLKFSHCCSPSCTWFSLLFCNGGKLFFLLFLFSIFTSLALFAWLWRIQWIMRLNFSKTRTFHVSFFHFLKSSIMILDKVCKSSGEFLFRSKLAKLISNYTNFFEKWQMANIKFVNLKEFYYFINC